MEEKHSAKQQTVETPKRKQKRTECQKKYSTDKMQNTGQQVIRKIMLHFDSREQNLA